MQTQRRMKPAAKFIFLIMAVAVLGGGFKVNNPNAKQSCGCSNSFSVEDKSSPCNSCNSL